MVAQVANAAEPRPRQRFQRSNSVEIVRKQFAHFDTTLTLSSGATLGPFTLAYETYSKLHAERSNAILICHALSGDSHDAGYYTDEPGEQPGWWDDAVGP